MKAGFNLMPPLSRLVALMKRHFYVAPIGALAALLLAWSLKAAQQKPVDPFAADKPIGPVKPGIFEPQRGVYLGAALDTSKLPPGDTVEALASQMRGWEKEAGRPHALYLHFLQFPNADGKFGTWDEDANGWISANSFALACEKTGATPILTLEPMQPKLLLDWAPGKPAYEATKAFAIAAGKWKKPLFIRWAHEMNGSWYPWAEWIDYNRNLTRELNEETGFHPADYCTVYRNVALMFRQYAPNAALIWCPNQGLLGGEKRDVFRPWYPGDDVVDWVGMDIYERGWKMPVPGEHLWGGQFAHSLTHDMTDDPATEPNESVNFYLVYGEWKKKPMMICETAATLSYRSDLPLPQRAQLSRDWKIGYWNPSEYGWVQGVYGTSDNGGGRQWLEPLDKVFPQIKAVVWFQIGKREYIPAAKKDGGFVWFDDQWADYRVGGGVEENAPRSLFAQQELDVYRGLIGSKYFLSRLDDPKTYERAGQKVAVQKPVREIPKLAQVTRYAAKLVGAEKMRAK